MMTKSISILTPTRGRPAGALRLFETAHETAENPDQLECLFYVDEDDPELSGYVDVPGVHVGEPISVSKSWNVIANLCHGGLLMMGNDDLIFKSRGWDEVLHHEVAKFPDGIFCMFFDDGINAGAHCAFSIVSRRWYETLGKFTPARLAAPVVITSAHRDGRARLRRQRLTDPPVVSPCVDQRARDRAVSQRPLN